MRLLNKILSHRMLVSFLFAITPIAIANAETRNTAQTLMQSEELDLANKSALQSLKHKSWFGGAIDCSTNTAPAIEVHQYNADTFILRQNKCLNYEAPFMYLLFGDNKALLIDTGATPEPSKFPLAETVRALMVQRAKTLNTSILDLPIIIAHSHSHGDHIAGDNQFKHWQQAKIIKTKSTSALVESFGFKNWPNENAIIDLGNRKVSVIPTPGHQAQAITFYDQQTQWLLTGDSIYPGRLYVREWQQFKDSVNRLFNFAKNHPISAVLGAHIEMSDQANKDYPTGSTYQPKEASLVLSLADVERLHQRLQTVGNKPSREYLDNMIIYPIE